MEVAMSNENELWQIIETLSQHVDALVLLR
jgi:hypothetical protein